MAMKFYTSSIPVDTHKENEVSSDVRKCFMKKVGDEVNSSVANFRETFEKDLQLTPIEGSLQINLEFPSVQGETPNSHVQGNDVVVYINCANMDTFFPNNKNMGDAKRIIKYVATQASSTTKRCQTCKAQNVHCTNSCHCTKDGKCQNRTQIKLITNEKKTTHKEES